MDSSKANQSEGQMLQEQNTAATQQEAPARQDTADKEAEKTFSQDQVNEIVQKRLLRDRESRPTVGDAGRLANELTQREKSLLLRERKLAAREHLLSLSLPGETAELLDYSSEEALEESLSCVKTLLQRIEQTAVDRVLREHAWTPEKSPAQTMQTEDPLRSAFLRD